MLRLHFAAVLPAFLVLAGCSSEAATTSQPKELRFSVLPDFNKAKLAENCKLLEAHLSKKLGLPVRYEPANDYTAAVNALIANKVDLVWLGGVTTCDALDEGKGQTRIVATRDIDLDFKTYFIANKKVLDEGKVKKLANLGELKAMAKNLSFTFGDKKSTSGHVMPRYFLNEAGIDATKDFKSEAGFQASGGHGATLKAVASGTTDLGALNFGYWDKASDEDKANAPIIYVTPGYVDYSWVAHQRLGEPMLQKLTEAFVKLDKNNPEDKAILDAWSAKEKFVTADAKLWDKCRKVRDTLPKGFLQ